MFDSAVGFLVSLGLYLALAAAIAVFLFSGGPKILWCWWRQPVGIGISTFALIILLDAPQMRDMFFGMAMGYSGGQANWQLWHAIGLGVASTWLALEGWYWTRAGLLSHLRVCDALWIRSQQNPRTGLIKEPAIAPDFAVAWAARIIMIFGGLAAAAPLLLYFYGRLPLHELQTILIPVIVGLVTLVIACFAVTHRNRLMSASLLDAFDIPPNSRLWKYYTISLFLAAPFGWLVGLVVFLASLVALGIIARAPGLVESSLHAPTAAILALSFLIAPMTVFLAVFRDAALFFILGVHKLYVVAMNKIRRQPGEDYALPKLDPIVSTVGLLLLLAWVSLNDAFGDIGKTRDRQYAVRQAGNDSASLVQGRRTLSQAVGAWQNKLAREGETGKLPLVIVAVEGGASRSAAWELSVLRMLDEATNGQFGRHIFAVSGVSGGSLGAATYVEMLKSGNWKSPPDFWNDAHNKNGLRELARGDLLAASIATFFLNDAVSRVLGYWSADDRGVALEHAFERHWQWDAGFAFPKANTEAGFLALRDGSEDRLPHLLLNGTEVRTGRRLITSSIAFTPQDDLFAASDDFLRRLNYDVPMSTAVTNSARFPFISPAGRFGERNGNEDNRGQVVDGGVFENYGVRTAWELARGIKNLKIENIEQIVPIIVLVSNDADGVPANTDPKFLSVSELRPLSRTAISCAWREEPAPPEQAKLGRETEQRERAEGGAILPDALTSAIGLYSTRGAHGRGELFTLRREFCGDGDERFFHIALPAPITEKDQAAPMNWVLNVAVCRFMFGDALTVDFNAQQVQDLADKLSKFGLDVGHEKRFDHAAECGALPGHG